MLEEKHKELRTLILAFAKVEGDCREVVRFYKYHLKQ